MPRGTWNTNEVVKRLDRIEATVKELYEEKEECKEMLKELYEHNKFRRKENKTNG